MGTATSPTDVGTDAEGRIVFDRLLDWTMGVVLAMLGLLAGAMGAGLYYAADRAAVATLLSDSEFRSAVLTETEAVDLLVGLGQWTGLGLIAAGALTVAAGGAVVVAHGRARRAGRSTPRWIVGLLGGLVGVVTSVLPFSPAIGGAVAGYLDPADGGRGLSIGAIAGLFGLLPILIVGSFAAVGAALSVPPELLALVVIVSALLAVFTMAVVVGLSTLGGYVGHRFGPQ